MGLFDFLKPQQSLNSSSDSQKLFLAVKNGALALNKTYKPLSDKGEFEVFLYNALIVLRIYKENQPSKYAHTKEGFYKEILNQAKSIGIAQNTDSLTTFINARFQFYSEELENIYDGEGYLPTKLYSAFYVTPLRGTLDPYFDPIETMKFNLALTRMIRSVDESAHEIK